MRYRRENGQFHREKDRGSAMIVAIIVSMVVVVFCLSLLLVSYALFSAQARRVTQNQCRELSKTISLELEKELTEPAFASFAEEQTDLDQGQNMLWHYLRFNICQPTWPYYVSEDTTGHNADAAYRYFHMNVTGGDNSQYTAMADDISVCIYWENDGSYQTSKGDVTLCVKVSCTKGNQTASMLSRYTLNCTSFANADATGDAYTTGKHGDNAEMIEAANPKGNNIATGEYWKWVFEERE